MRATGPGQPAQFLLDIVDFFNELRIPYAIVGALAVSYYGIPRSTTDSDATIWLNGTGKSAHDLRDGLIDRGYPTQVTPGDAEDPIVGIISVNDIYDNRSDLILGVRGMDAGASDRCVLASFMVCQVRIIGAEDLVAMKVFAGGPQDLEDVRGILSVSRDSLKSDLLRRLAGRYGSDVLNVLDKLLSDSRQIDE